MLLEQLLGSLEAKERELIYLRFFSGKNTDADCRRTWNFTGSGVENGEKDFKSFKGTD